MALFRRPPSGATGQTGGISNPGTMSAGRDIFGGNQINYFGSSTESLLAYPDREELWLPLLHSAQGLRETLLNLTELYHTPPIQWDNHAWKDSSGIRHPLPLEARDFQELYLLDSNVPPIEDFYSQPSDPGQRRRDESAVQRVRSRVHELNRATVAMYKMAVYLGYAYQVRRALAHQKLPIPARTRLRLVGPLEGVRNALNGPTGAGFVNDLQDLLGESVWEAGNIIGYNSFRERIFSAVGWEQFAELFRFFLHFHYKVDYEVKQTVEALRVLCMTLEDDPGGDAP